MFKKEKMMKKLLLICALALASVAGWSQMTFATGSLSDALKTAEKEKKYVFVDVYTTWCGPCKHMTSNIFPDKSVGDLMNAKFVNIKIDAEKGEGVDVAKTYAVKGYPTMLILDSKGKELARIMGASRAPADFIKAINGKLAEIKK